MARKKVTFTEHWTGLDADGKMQLSEDTGITVKMLSQYAHGHRNPERFRAAAICELAGRKNLFPANAYLEKS